MNVKNALFSSNLVGVGLRPPHYSYVLEETPPVGWLEIHPENYFMKGGLSLSYVDRLSETYPFSLHSIGVSLGSAQGVNQHHLSLVRDLVQRWQPFLLSDHLSWSRVDDAFFPDLLPVPYTDEALQVFSENIAQVQDFLGREILIENPSSYLEYKESCIEEAEFLNTLCKKTGAKILLDVNNIFVSASNHEWDACAYIDSIDPNLVKEVHLAGHARRTYDDGAEVLIDSHSTHVCDEVWNLYDYTIQRGIIVPTLIEWDSDLPEFNVLLKEAQKAQQYILDNEKVHE